MTRELQSQSEAETRRIASCLASLLAPGEQRMPHALDSVFADWD